MQVLAGAFCGIQMMRRHVAGLHVVESAYEQDQLLPWHVHRWPYFTFVLRGGYSEQCETRTWEIGQGDVVLHQAGEAHADRIHTPSRLLNLEFTPCWLERIESSGARLDGRVSANGGYLLELGKRLHRELWSEERISALCIEGLALELIAAAAGPTLRPPRRGSWLDDAKQYLREHFRGSPTLREVAAAVHVHPVHLAREFRRTEGVTVGEYIRRLRVDLACRELADTTVPIVEIALKSGFADHSHMTRVFRRHLGLTPSEYRKRRGG